jgi:D-alanyl-lipoteichoic acid acyltransferase DltB (MBOAT superfamily)
MAGVNPSLLNAPAVCGCYKARTDMPRDVAEYDIVSYFAYVLYLPLYVAGPITSYNAFVSHVHRPQTAVVGAALWRYAARTVGLYVCLVGFLHIFWVNAVRALPDLLHSFNLLDQMLVMWFTLAFLWLKFNCIWKTFRTVALLDGVEAPEDMKRCFANTVTIAEFWRDWHASFNLWIVRYMYVPMGGMNNKYLAMPAIFLFIALWHDTRLELLSWAAIMSITFFLELAATAIFSRRSIRAVLRPLPFYRQLRSLGGACTIGSLIVANVIGFGTGMKTTGTIGSVLTSQNAALAAGTFFMFYVASTVNVAQRMIDANRRAQQQTALDSEIALAAGR